MKVSSLLNQGKPQSIVSGMKPDSELVPNSRFATTLKVILAWQREETMSSAPMLMHNVSSADQAVKTCTTSDPHMRGFAHFHWWPFLQHGATVGNNWHVFQASWEENQKTKLYHEDVTPDTQGTMRGACGCCCLYSSSYCPLKLVSGWSACHTHHIQSEPPMCFLDTSGHKIELMKQVHLVRKSH